MTNPADMEVGGPGPARVALVLVHGRTLSPEWMQAHVLDRLDLSGLAVRLPRAAGGSWYAARAVDPLTDATRAELDAALAQLDASVTAARATGLPVMLAGFSQGACLSVEYLLRHGARVDALAALTGCRVGAAADHGPAAALDGLPVYLSGSDADPWIPLPAFATAAAALGAARANLRADLFPGRPHEVSAAEIAVLAAMLADLAAGAALLGRAA
jgi:phospholipase/carboxylesterase